MRQCVTLVLAALIGMAIVELPRTPARADDTARPGLDDQLEQFWETWETRSPSEALRRFAPAAQDTWNTIFNAADDYHNRLGGRCVGHAEIERRNLSDHVVYVASYALYDTQPMRVQLLYYRIHDKWTGIACHVDMNPALWLREQGHMLDVTSSPDVQVIPIPTPTGQTGQNQ